MVRATIDGMQVEAPAGTSILEAARTVGVHIPTLCYLKEFNEIGACRVCLVEIKGMKRLVASCNNAVEEGMDILTNSPKVREARRVNVQLLLSQHDSNCPSCVRSGSCSLQKLAGDLNVYGMPYEKKVPPTRWTMDFPLIRETGKCIKCLRCVQVCDKVQSLGVWHVTGSGSRSSVDVSGNRRIERADCVLCGQCITHCPVGALHVRDDTQRAFAALADPDKITVVQVAPAVRTAWGESLGLPREFATAKRLVAALRKMGFDYIFDTNWSADLTIMEEGTEFVHKLKERDKHKLPMFTSCCPGWVRFLKSQYPDMVGQLSSAKSPQQMFGAVAKSYYARLLGVDPSRIFCVSIMPCVAKKKECDLPTMNSAGAGQDVDLVLTTRELTRMIRADHITPDALTEMDFDSPLGTGTGAAVIFGATGGVMEAALRSAYYLVTGGNPPVNAFQNVRGLQGWKESTFEIAGIPVRVAVVHGLGNARRLLEALRRGQAAYDFVEVMACPGGCGGGGGQPICDGQELAGVRDNVLYALDEKAPLRFSHENPSVQKLYEDYLGQPGSELAHHLLHTDHEGWEMPLSLELSLGGRR